MLIVHAEACRHLHRTLGHVRELGASPAVALNPSTPASAVAHVLDLLDMVLVMTVNPGFGGQPYIPTMEPKVAEIRAMADDQGHDIDIEVDGGIGPATIAGAASADNSSLGPGLIAALAGAAIGGLVIPAVRVLVRGLGVIAVAAVDRRLGCQLELHLGHDRADADDDLLALEAGHARGVVERDGGAGVERGGLGAGAGRAHLGRLAARAPDPERALAVADHASDPEIPEVAEVVRVKVTDEDLV